MDFELTTDQQAITEAVATVLRRHAGVERARAVGGKLDAELLDALSSGGFLDLATDPQAGPLEAALVAEAAAREVACAPVAARVLIAPFVLGDDAPTSVAVAEATRPGAVRYGADAEVVIVIEGDEARAGAPRTIRRIPSEYGYPLAQIDPTGGRSLGPGTGPLVRQWWQVALAVEAAGTVAAALERTVDYLTHRHQFGVPIGSLQAIQHRLAEAHVWVQGALWSARKAAWSATAHDAASAATYAGLAIKAVGPDLHQLTGAIGFTREYDLHLWTLRLMALRAELGGVGAHARTLAATRWG